MGKSFLAAAVVAEEAMAGRTTIYLDFEGTAAMFHERLSDAGLSDEQTTLVLYLRPELRAEPAEIRAMVADLEPSVVVVDSFDAALSAYALSPDKGEDVRTFEANVMLPLRSTGSALLLNDHVVKRAEDRGRYSKGSQDKLAVVDVHLGLTALAALRRSAVGKLRLKTHKDRHGWLPLQAVFELTSHELTGALSWQVRAEESAGDDAGSFRPTRLMEKVSIYLGAQAEPVTLRSILDSVKGNRDATVQAVNVLVAEEYADEQAGPRGARMFVSLKPYREADDGR